MKILLLTSIYPIPNVKITGSTSVCHYFAKEWVKQGHEVLVINTYTVYPRVLHWMSGMFESKIANYCTVSINKTRYSEPFEYCHEGVKVYLTPTFKLLPRGLFRPAVIKTVAQEIVEYLNVKGFAPDVMVGHFLHPNFQLLPILKKQLSNIPTGIVLHGRIRKERDIRMINESKREIDFWGFRSNPIGESFKSRCYVPSRTFDCHSGIPETYIKIDGWEKHCHPNVKSFIYVGNLMQRKHPLTVIEGLVKSGIDFELEYIGSGEQGKRIAKYALRHHAEARIKFLGRIPREDVAKKMQESECFIMVSEQETFGLVYLEAMAAGCITIASRNEGMDNIILDGKNGFLCTAGDSDELDNIIKHINSMTPAEKIEMSKNAIKTAQYMTDSNCSQRYVNYLSSVTE